MDKPDFPETPTWTTWEELLLACAVHRYGTHSWDSVASQLRKRCSNLHHLSPDTCRHKFHDLRRRFDHPNDAACDGDDKSSPIPWLDKLRQLRLDELRQEVERHDSSIVSLQLKVERLKEVREKSDLERSGDEGIRDTSAAPESASPVNITGRVVSGEVFVRNDGRSSNESNTTDPKPELPETVVGEKDAGLVEPAAGEVGAVEKLSNPMVVEDSCNGSSDSVVKEPPVAESEKASSGELRESRSNSEVQSTASLSRKLGAEVKANEPVEPDQEDQSPAMNQAPVESQPLVEFLKILRSHKAASFFERRLQSQETPIYTCMIRQHTDFESVQTRLNAGWYSSCKRKFFRDVLLICKNAIVFFGQRSPEYKAACELQLLILKEMACKDANQDPSPKQDSQTLSKEETPTPLALPLKAESESSESLLAKSKLSIPLTACRKRSSIKARASTSSLTTDIKKEQKTTSLHDIKPAISWKQKEETLDEVEEQHPVTKKRRKERAGSNTRNNSNKNSKSRGDANKEKNPDADTNAIVDSSTRAMIKNDNSEFVAVTEKKSTNNTSGKRQSAEKFLSRMKRGSASNKKSETLKIPENDSTAVSEQKRTGNSRGNGQKAAEPRKNGNGNGKGSAQKEVAEPKKTANGKGSAQKEQASRKVSGGRQAAKEQGSPSKRGRPLKRAAETAKAAPAKRRR
ncbi:uncharacterized protein LOC126800006 [Argentina anserina]|uniref:uncharacterized protein LOC126800006 n=1 Tax=Argentina anserina TaxID=57926 RepID=UPI002176593C|nr:uncharacterized protein LOC126800006 [Potentilla anserina]